MKYETATIFMAILGLATAAPTPEPKNTFNLPTVPKRMLRGREVPQEHSHNRFLDGVRVNLALNNPAGISDPVFGLLGNAAAAKGAGTITNTDCLHQATADQAFTNAKAAGNVTGMADALLYAALERNTGSVGLASVICNETAVNPEIAAVQQHQDPASPGAAATNKAIVLSLAKQLASIGADPQEALLSGTFAPGTIGDTTGAGNTCDTADDEPGCIFSQNLIVNDATAEEITAAAGGTLGGAPPPVISSTGTRPFSVNGDTFVGEGAALQRSCSVQHNACATAANSGSISGGVAQCETQEQACNAASAAAKRV
ncbi:hypothetical protein CJF30_00001802 [Rutstroemia sp. NJR-2017a BBW]|nr:hypothetical protein CJF30_00001802 [Rutstroemia sp. NJR-2017a BBW]